MATHDALFKAAFAQASAAAALLEAALPASVFELLDPSTIEIVRPSFVTGRLTERFADLLLSVRTRRASAPLLLLVEHKSRVERFAVLDLLERAISAWQDSRRTTKPVSSLPRVGPVLLHHGPRRWDAPLELRGLFADPETDDVLARQFDPTFRVCLLDYGGEPDPERRVATIADPLARCVLYLLTISRRDDYVDRLRAHGIPLLAEVWRPDGAGEWRWLVLEYIAAWLPADFEVNSLLKKSAEHRDRARSARARRAEEAYQWNDMATMPDDAPALRSRANAGPVLQQSVREIERMIGEHVHPEAERHMKTAREVMIEKARREGFEKGIEKGVEKGIEKGIDRGIERGIERGLDLGLARGEALAIREFLSARFGTSNPAIDSLLDELRDPTILRRLIRAAAVAESLVAFERSLREITAQG